MAAWLPLALAGAYPAYAQDGAIDGNADGAVIASTDRAELNTLQPFYGNIDPFYGNIDPFYGNIDPFYGNIDPFYGNIDPFQGKASPFFGNVKAFWGNIDPFATTATPFWGNIDPFASTTLSAAPGWAAIQPFWQTVGAKWQATNAQWGAAGSTFGLTGYASVASGLRDIVKLSEATWGAAVSAKTGTSFSAGFAAPLLAKFGIDLDKPATLAALTPAQRSQFFLAWYDGLMAYSGHDQVDHWMATVNWTPAITQQQGSGADTVIGLLDSDVSRVADLAARVIQTTGQNGFAGGHGAGVASLMVAAHDGSGIMGIAPRASVVLHNPFDATGTASWTDVRQGIVALKARNASIINASLGESGTVLPTSWNSIFSDPAVASRKGDTVYVIAAGNEGITQTQNIEWGAAMGTNFLLVGSVDQAGNISSFSNRPGDACLLNNGVCASGSKLMNRFITAPGELILVSDGMGGTVRRTGTSFAAPLVSGAIALLHDRWPWLAKDPAATVEIILRSAKDLGAKGVDPVYGVGLLDVTASQSPLDWNALQYYKVRGGTVTGMSVATLQAGGVRSTWEANGVYFTLFERVGNSTRDFAVPMSSQLSGSVTTAFGSKEEYQRFLTQRLTDFINKSAGGQFTDVASYTTPDQGGWRMSIASQDPSAYLSGSTGRVPHSSVRAAAPGGGMAFSAGYGAGAMALTGQRGFGMMSDFSPDGGVNPLLVLASGGSFFNSEVRLSPRTHVSFGYTERDLAAADDPSRSRADRLFGHADDLRAHALNVSVNHDFAPGTGLSIHYTKLREDDALLAVQASNDFLSDGSHSEALTLGGTADLGHGLSVAASATAGRSRTRGDAQLTTNGAGVVTSAFAVTATKNGVIGSNDRLRLSVSQPMHIETGSMTLHAAQVVDRATGEVAVVDSRFDIQGAARVHTAELLYASPIQDGRGEISLFGRATAGQASDYRTGVAGGFRIRLDM